MSGSIGCGDAARGMHLFTGRQLRNSVCAAALIALGAASATAQTVDMPVVEDPEASARGDLAAMCGTVEYPADPSRFVRRIDLTGDGREDVIIRLDVTCDGRDGMFCGAPDSFGERSCGGGVFVALAEGGYRQTLLPPDVTRATLPDGAPGVLVRSSDESCATGDAAGCDAYFRWDGAQFEPVDPATLTPAEPAPSEPSPPATPPEPEAAPQAEREEPAPPPPDGVVPESAVNAPPNSSEDTPAPAPQSPVPEAAVNAPPNYSTETEPAPNAEAEPQENSGGVSNAPPGLPPSATAPSTESTPAPATPQIETPSVTPPSATPPSVTPSASQQDDAEDEKAAESDNSGAPIDSAASDETPAQEPDRTPEVAAEPAEDPAVEAASEAPIEAAPETAAEPSPEATPQPERAPGPEPTAANWWHESLGEGAALAAVLGKDERSTLILSCRPGDTTLLLSLAVSPDAARTANLPTSAGALLTISFTVQGEAAQARLMSYDADLRAWKDRIPADGGLIEALRRGNTVMVTEAGGNAELFTATLRGSSKALTSMIEKCGF